MPITPPAVGNVQIPTGFTALSAQNQVAMNWNQTPLATTYYINRSTDGITFTTVGQTSALSFSDTTGTNGTLYYYTLQAATALASSLPTPAIQAIPLDPGMTTVGNIKLICKQRADKLGSQFYSEQEWNSMISESYKELYDILVQKFGDDYFEAVPYTFTTTGRLDPVTKTQIFPLPSDFYKLKGVEVALNPADPNAWVSLREFNFVQRNLWNFPNVYTFYGITNLRYRMTGKNLEIVPIASANQTIRIRYIPRPNQLVADTDLVDGVSGWEEYIVADTCIKALAKEESEVQVFAAQKMALLKRIEEAAENRNVGEPETVSDSKLRNFAWSDDGQYGGGNVF